jgi:hypothetical protein
MKYSRMEIPGWLGPLTNFQSALLAFHYGAVRLRAGFGALMTVSHIYTVAFQGIEARRSTGQPSAAKASAVRPSKNMSALR